MAWLVLLLLVPLQLRVPLDDLQLVAPEAVQKLKRISRALEQSSLRDSVGSVSDTSKQVISMGQEAARYRRLNDDWLTTLEEVRSLDGFCYFFASEVADDAAACRSE